MNKKLINLPFAGNLIVKIGLLVLLFCTGFSFMNVSNDALIPDSKKELDSKMDIQYYESLSISNLEISQNRRIEADEVIFEKGGMLRVTNGASLTIIAEELTIEGKFTIDGTGNRGEKGADKGGEWCSHNCDCGFHNQGHHDWEVQCGISASGHPTTVGGDGGPGGPGANIYIQYEDLSLVSGSLSNITARANGGMGGAGGRGLKQKCSCHPDEICWGRNGFSGTNGEDGKVTFSKK